VGVAKYWAISRKPTYRTWVASRRYGDPMSVVRAAQAHHTDVLARMPRWAVLDEHGRWCAVAYGGWALDAAVDLARPRPDGAPVACGI